MKKMSLRQNSGGAMEQGSTSNFGNLSKRNKCWDRQCTPYACIVTLVMLILTAVTMITLVVYIFKMKGGIGLGLNSMMNMDIGIRNDYLLQDCSGGKLKRSFPDLDYALMGYHVLKGYPLAKGHDPGFTHPIFKADYTEERQTDDCKFSIPKGYIIVPDVSCQTALSSETISNSQELKEAMGVSAKVSGGGWGLSFSASAGYKAESQSLESGESVIVISRATCQYYFASIDEVTPPPFHESFIQWAKILNDKDSKDEDFLEFISYYGTHFMKSVTFGARFMYQHKMSKTTREAMKSTGASVEAQLGFSGFGVSASGGFSYNQDNSEKTKNFKQNVKTETITVGSPPPKDGDAMSWASSVKQTPVPYKYVTESIEEVFSSRYMKNLPNINGERIRKYLQYIQMRYRNEIFERSLERVCRVYNAAYQLPPKFCLRNHKQQAVVKSEKECIERCLYMEDCIGVTLALIDKQQTCFTFSSSASHSIKVEKGSNSENCQSTLFPYKLTTSSTSYRNKPIPGKLQLHGITFKLTSSQTRQLYGKSCSQVSREACEQQCLDKTSCIIATYISNPFNSNQYCCWRVTEQTLYNWEVKESTDTKEYATFVKTC